MPIRINSKYRPLRDATTRYIIVTGGRGSGKSFALASALLDDTYEDGCATLFTRWNLTSAEISVIPEFTEKMDLGNCRDAFIVRQRDVQNRATGGRVFFRGLQQSSKNQIAKLKSVNRLKTWVLDEAQELMSELMFDIIDLSIREKDVQNRVILVLNPADISHWIYRRFFLQAGVPYDFNGVKGNVTYIHTTWEDNRQNLSQSFIDAAEEMRLKDPDKYAHIYDGAWLIRKEGLIYKNWEPITDAEYPIGLPQFYANDWGFSGDPNALVRMCYQPHTGILFVKQLAYKTGMQPRDVARAIIADASKIVHHIERDPETGEERKVYYRPSDCILYCDPARPEHIKELRTSYGIAAAPANNRDKTGRIGYLQGFQVRYVGDDIGAEASTYSWLPSPQDDNTFTDVPQDGNDHAMDAINYGATSHLRRLGISAGA